MNKMTLMLLATGLTTSAFAEEKVTAKIPYVSIGLGPAPVPLPIFGVGYRAQWDHYGVNGSVNVSTLYWVTGVKGSLLFNYYKKPNLDSQFYFGIGPAVGLGIEKRVGVAFASEFAFGKQYINEAGDLRFCELTIDFPCAVDSKHGVKVFPIPIVIFNYGIGF
jgi:hypothetical protein